MSTSLHKFQQLKIGDVCIVNPRKDISQVSADFITFVPMESASPDGQIDTSKIISIEKAKNYTFFKEGDILFAKITPCMENGKGGIAKGLLNGYGAGSTEFIVLRPDPAILINKWLSLFLSQKSFRHECLSHTKGSAGQKRVPPSYIANCSIPIPSTEEQERIISKIEELFSEIDNAVSSLKTAKRKLEIYRSAVLKHAFSNSDKWEKLSLGELMKEVRNGCGTKPSDSGNYKILTIGSVRAMKVSIDEHRYNDKPFDEKDRIHENDLLFTRYNGSREFVGVCGVVPRLSESYAYPDKLIRFTPKINNSIHSKYIQFYVSQGKARRYIRSKIKTSSGQNGIAGSDLKKTEIHLPSLQEQKRIVENIELKFGVYEDIDCTISCALRRAESLKQSILKKAFEGELL